MRVGVELKALAAAVLLFAAATVAPAGAQPGGDPAEVALGWRAVGLEPQTLIGPNTPATFTVPVPNGLNPVRLRGLIHAPVNIQSGFLEIDDDDGTFLAAVNLPPMAAEQAVVPLDVDIAAATVRNASVGLTFTVRPTDRSDQSCGPVQQVSISELSTVYAGSEPPPSTIAAFFPPVLERVTVYAPLDAEAAEQQSVLTLVSTLSRLYQPIPLDVDVVNLPRGAVPPAAGPLARAVVVERGSAGLTVEAPGGPDAYLRVSGQGDELTSQVSLLENDLQSLAQVPVARVDQPGATEPVTGDTLTFGQLAMTGRADVLRSSTLNTSVDRAALGAGRVDGVRVHLLADYTPVGYDDSATVTVRSNNAVLLSTPLDKSGRLDATFDVPAQVLSQTISLDFTITFTPHQECGPFIAPMSFQVDPSSTLTVHRGGAPLGGFGAVPSEFSPEFFVAFDGSDQSQLIYAGRVVADIARLTRTKLSPKVTDFQSAVNSQSGALIVARSSAIDQTSLRPPLSGDGSAVSADLTRVLRADIENGLGSVQAFADPVRNRLLVLVTTTGAWPLVEPLFGYIDSLDEGWSQLTGNVLAAGSAGTPTNVSINSSADTPELQSESSAPWLAIGLAVVAVVVVAALVMAWLLARRRRSRRDDGEAEPVSGDAPVTRPEPRP